MGAGKILGLLILMVITFPIGGFIWVPILFFGWKYVKFCIKIDLIVIYLIVRLPIWLFIQLPLYSLKQGTQRIDMFFSRGFNALNRRRKLSSFLLIIFGLFFLFLFPLNMNQFQILSAYFWWNNFWSLLQVLVGSVGTTLITVSIVQALSGNIAQKEMPGDWARSELFGADPVGESVGSAKRAVKGVEKGKKSANKAKGVYNEIKATELEAAQLKSALPTDMSKMLNDLARSMGLRSGAAEAAAAASSNPLGWAAIGVFLLALLLFVVQFVVVMVFFYGYLQFLAPLVLGPVTEALGLGADYGNFIGRELGDRYLAGFTASLDPIVSPVLEARQRVFCLLEGPACLRQWRLNNTQTPGSNAVGEQYLLDIDRLEVGSGSELDIAYRDGDYSVPLSFGISNSRNGLKGINARNVSYRVKMIDFERGRDNPFCETGWRPIDGYNIRNTDDSTEFTGNDLYPGTSASTGFLRLDEFNLENCGMLQPGAGETRTVLLEVKYDYFSQATLYFDAMARETLLSNPDIEKEWKPSETADTPVKSALNVNHPVIYNQDQLDQGPDASQPFAMRASLYTEESDVSYKVKNIEVTKSSQVEIQESDNRQCSFRNSGDDNKLVLDSNRGILQDEQISDSSDGEQDDWYNEDDNPPFFGCTMRLNDPASISPEGETLTMGVASNYTVKMDEQLERFEIMNTRCSDNNCPLLVTREFAESSDVPQENWKYVCEGPDAGRAGASRGCSVVRGEGDWSNIEKMTGDNKLDSRLETGEVAIDLVASNVFDGVSYYSQGDADEGEFAVGLRPQIIERIENSYYTRPQDGFYGWVLVSEQGEDNSKEIVLEQPDEKLCSQNVNDQLNNMVEDSRGNVVAYDVVTSNDACENPSSYEDIPSCGEAEGQQMCQSEEYSHCSWETYQGPNTGTQNTQGSCTAN